MVVTVLSTDLEGEANVQKCDTVDDILDFNEWNMGKAVDFDSQVYNYGK